LVHRAFSGKAARIFRNKVAFIAIAIGAALIESTFATIRHRTDQAKGCVSRDTMLAMIYKLGMCAQKR